MEGLKATGDGSPGIWLWAGPVDKAGLHSRMPKAARLAGIAISCGLLLLLFVILLSPHFARTGPGNESLQKRDAVPAGHFAMLNWRPSSSRIVGYNVYRADKTGGPYLRLNPSPVPETVYKDSGVQPGHTYFYLVTAVDAKGNESGYSNQGPALIPAP